MKSSSRVFYFGILPALFFQAVAAYFYFLSGLPAHEIIYTTSKIFIFTWPLFWLPLIRKNFSYWKGSPFKAIVHGFCLGLFMSFLIFTVAFFLQNTLETAAPAIHEKIQEFHLSNPAIYITFTIFLSLLHSFLEEYYWRWFVFRGLSLHMLWPKAAFLASAAFAFHHYIILSQFFPLSLTLIFGILVGVGGFFWCALYQKTQSLLAPWLSHALVDASLMMVGYFLLF